MKILLVDDDDSNRELARRMLARVRDIEVVLAGSGAECLAAARNALFDAILLDIRLPDMGGVDVCAALRILPAYADCRIVACTAHAGPKELERFLASGFSAVLTKPFLIEDLHGVVGLIHACAPRALQEP